jgi:AmiR/NasT family two-component response regulator
MFRLWLLQSQTMASDSQLSQWLADLQVSSGGEFVVVGCSDWTTALPAAVRKGEVEAIVCRVAHHEEELAAASLAGLPVPILFVVNVPLRSPQRLVSVVQQAAVMPVSAGPDGLYTALLSLRSALVRQRELLNEIARLRDKLEQRLLIEKAKALLIQQQGLSEEQAYLQLRGLSRRQRRPMAEVARELLEQNR